MRKKVCKRKECFEIEVWKEKTKDRKRRAKEREKKHTTEFLAERSGQENYKFNEK